MSAMQSKDLLRQAVLLILTPVLTGILAGATFSTALFFDHVQQSSNLTGEREAQSGAALPAVNTATHYEQEAPSGLPIHLSIPNINVDAAVEYVGHDPLGAMDAPQRPEDVAWFELGPRPGENGSAVIAGHYGWKDGKAAVFDKLHTLQRGDRLYVEDGEGTITTFVVRESRKYDPKADASDVFGSSDGKAHLNLVTCEGVWNKAEKSYSNRLVVFTDKEMEYDKEIRSP